MGWSAKRKPDYEGDPLSRLEHNERSTRLAVIYGAVSLVVVLSLSAILAITVGVHPGHGITADRLIVLLGPLAVSLVLTGGAMWQTYARWRDHVRWRPWLWLTQLMWIGTTAYLVLGGSLLLVSSPTGY